MSPRQTAMLDRHVEAETPALLPGSEDKSFYLGMVPRHRASSPAVEAADAAVEAITERIATAADRRREAIRAGDMQAALSAEHDGLNGPLELHIARLAAAQARIDHWEAEAARLRAEGTAFAPHVERIRELQHAVLTESGRIAEAVRAAEGYYTASAEAAAEARRELERLRGIDPLSEPDPRLALKVPTPAFDDPTPYRGASIWKIATNGREIVGINGKAIVKVDADGSEARVDGYRVRVDGVLVDDDDQPVKERSGRLRRFVDGLT